MNVILMSGISGAGKSTYIRKRFGENPIVCSADHYFMQDGVYRFNPKLLPEAHGYCLRQYISFCHSEWLSQVDSGHDIIVDNTNTTVEELAPYVSIAAAYKHPIELVTIHCPPEIAAARSLHVNSLPALQAMYARIMDRQIPRFWRIKETHINMNGETIDNG